MRETYDDLRFLQQKKTYLKIALRHPDINPTAVVKSIMSMLPKMYAALLEHGDEETDPTFVVTTTDCRRPGPGW
jgi:hypothetical protein